MMSLLEDKKNAAVVNVYSSYKIEVWEWISLCIPDLSNISPIITEIIAKVTGELIQTKYMQTWTAQIRDNLFFWRLLRNKGNGLDRMGVLSIFFTCWFQIGRETERV